MWADLHAHFPMHIVSDPSRESTVKLMGRVRHRRSLKGRIQAAILWLAMKFGSDRKVFGGHRISVEKMRTGEVGLAMSVLYCPFKEIDLGKRYAAPPGSDYFESLLEDMAEVEGEVNGKDRSSIRLVKNLEQLDRCLEDEAIALVHAVEGGFHLGDSDEEIRRNCVTLAEEGVAYVTVAHLFFRQVATNAPALPFLPDSVYRVVFPQYCADPLTPRGKTVVRELVRNRILVDLCHMDPAAIHAVFDLLDDELDPQKHFPVVSTHSGFRFGKQQYMPDETILERIAERDGVVGLIMAQHQLNDGLRKDETKSLEDSLVVIFEHIRKIAEVTGGYEHIALGTDFDGFIKPTMSGLDTMADLPKLERAMRNEFGDPATEMMTSQNALRVLRTVWGGDKSP